MNSSNKPVLAIAGASGFIGRWFIHRYKEEFNIVGFSRSPVRTEKDHDIEWRQVDLFVKSKHRFEQ